MTEGRTSPGRRLALRIVAAPPLAGVACALRVHWRRAGAWLVGLTAAGLGLGSLLLSDHLGVFDAPWARLAFTWGIVLVVLAEVDARARAPVEVS